MFKSLGARTLSADDLARDILAKDSPAYHEAVHRFGERILAESGEIDRATLGDIVFGDAEARQALNDITHPRIIKSIEQRIAAFRHEAGTAESVMAVEIPLLVECGLEWLVDEVLLVAAEQPTQVNRLTSVGRFTAEQALQRIHAQMPIREKIDKAERVIWNDGDLRSLEDSVKRVWDEILLL
jgi:dephospho-CoA kinase